LTILSEKLLAPCRDLCHSLATCCEVEVSNTSLLSAAVGGLHRGTGWAPQSNQLTEKFQSLVAPEVWKSLVAAERSRACEPRRQRAVLQGTVWEGRKIFPLLAIPHCRETRVLFQVPWLWHHPVATARFCMCWVNNRVPLVCAEFCAFAFRHKAEPHTSAYQQARSLTAVATPFLHYWR